MKAFVLFEGTISATGSSTWSSDRGARNDPMSSIFIKMETARLGDVVQEDVVGGEKKGFMQAVNLLLGYIVRNAHYIKLKRIK